MKKFSFIVMCVLMFGYGCITYTNIDAPKPVVEEQQEVSDNITREWNPEQKRFWEAMLFAQLTQMPNVRQRFLPFHLHKMVVCAIAEYERRYELEYFVKVFGQPGGGKLNPENQKIAFEITYECSQTQLQIQQKEMMELKMKGEIDPKDAV